MANIYLDFSLANESISRNYVFKDITADFFITDNKRDISINLDAQAIQGGLENIFMFLPGERILLPEFGNSLDKYLYEGMNNFTAERLGKELNTIFEKWEPRIKIQDINIIPTPDENTYYIEVQYYIPSLGKNTIMNFSKALNIRR